MIVSFYKKPAFETVYEDSYHKLYKYAYMLVLNREDAEDVVSETFITAFSHYDEYKPEKGSIITWLSSIAHNEAIDLMRSAAYKSRSPMPEKDIRGGTDPAITKMTETNETVEYILSRLSVKEREFLNLRYGLELSDKEIGALLDEKENTINKRYQRLLKKCRDIADGRLISGQGRTDHGDQTENGRS